MCLVFTSLFLLLVFRGIAALHQYKGVCHRDIKSFNFLGMSVGVL